MTNPADKYAKKAHTISPYVEAHAYWAHVAGQKHARKRYFPLGFVVGFLYGILFCAALKGYFS